MIEFEIDGKKIEVAEGSMIIEAADNAGVYIPRFCYHKKLTIAANCRMCLVEVEKSKKPLPACATPVTNGMRVFTTSSLAVDAQRSVMEFLLINHPLDCPICDQGGECELQDLSMGYGRAVSRYDESKRSIYDENLGPLISTEMTRCIQCTRCVRFGSEIAGLPELGAIDRGEDMRISTYVHHTMKSELSGNIIDLCPVGALTSKPFRFSARAWELKQSPSIAPHDCVGSNTHVHTRGFEFSDYRKVMRVVPKENENINENWLSDRDRFGYEGINSPDRLLKPQIKRDSHWIEVDWATALNLTVEKMQQIKKKSGEHQISAIASPNSTLEEFYLLQKMLRAFGCHNLDHRIHQTDFRQQDLFPEFPSLGMELPEIEAMNVIVLVGANTRQEQPLLNNRIRKAALKGAKIIAINPIDYDFNYQLTEKLVLPFEEMPKALAGLLKAVAGKKIEDKDLKTLLKSIKITETLSNIAQCLQQKGHILFLLGHQAVNHPEATAIRAFCQLIVGHCDAALGTLSDGANGAGAWLAGMIPHRGPAGSKVEGVGLNAYQVFVKNLKSYFLFNIEPELDCANPAAALEALEAAEFVVCFTPFVSNAQRKYADVLLPIAPFFENSGTFVNTVGHWQSFEAVTPCKEECRPAWKVFRVLANLLNLSGFEYNHHSEVRDELKALVESTPIVERTQFVLPEDLQTEPNMRRITEWPMYSTDNVLRRAKSLQDWLAMQDHIIAIRINAKLAEQLGIHSGQMISVSQDDKTVYLPIVVDNRIPGENVLIPAGLAITAGFGDSYGLVDLMRGKAYAT